MTKDSGVIKESSKAGEATANPLTAATTASVPTRAGRRGQSSTEISALRFVTVLGGDLTRAAGRSTRGRPARR